MCNEFVFSFCSSSPSSYVKNFHSKLALQLYHMRICLNQCTRKYIEIHLAQIPFQNTAFNCGCIHCNRLVCKINYLINGEKCIFSTNLRKMQKLQQQYKTTRHRIHSLREQINELHSMKMNDICNIDRGKIMPCIPLFCSLSSSCECLLGMHFLDSNYFKCLFGFVSRHFIVVAMVFFVYFRCFIDALFFPSILRIFMDVHYLSGSSALCVQRFVFLFVKKTHIILDFQMMFISNFLVFFLFFFWIQHQI